MSENKFWTNGGLWLAKSAIDFAAGIRPDMMPHLRELTVYVVFGAGVTAGTVVVEAAHDPAYAGTWSNIATLAWSAASKVSHASIPGVHRAVRLRISVGIVNGTCDAYAVGD